MQNCCIKIWFVRIFLLTLQMKLDGCRNGIRRDEGQVNAMNQSKSKTVMKHPRIFLNNDT